MIPSRSWSRMYLDLMKIVCRDFHSQRRLNFSGYWTIILLFFCIGYDVVSSFEYQGVRMRPKQPILLVGQKMDLCCLSFVSPDDPIDLSSVLFTCHGKSLRSEPYKVEEEKKVCTRFTAVSKDEGMCECRNGDERKASQFLKVDDPPSISGEDLSCLFYEEIFKCSWKHQTLNYPEQVTTELLYHVHVMSPFSTVLCQNYNAPCEIKEISGVLSSHYNVSLRMIYNTTLGSVQYNSPWTVFSLPLITKYPKFDFKVEDKNESCITLRWTQVKRNSDFDIMQITYTSQWDPNKAEISNSTIAWPNDPIPSRANEIWKKAPIPTRIKKLCGLTPSTRYTITVMIRPSTSLVWSEPAIFTETTKDSVPERSPPTIPGAFTKIHSNKAVIYWKLLSEKEWQSDEMEGTYHLSIWNTSSSDWQEQKSLTWNVSQTEITLLEEQDTLIKLQAYNHNGPAKNYSEIRIQFNGIPAPINVIAEIDEAHKNVSFSWDSEYDKEYVFFWCLQQKENQCRQGTIDWQNYSISNKSVHIEDLSPSLKYMFGVSVSHLNVFSGIMWTKCTENLIFRSNCSPLYKTSTESENETERITVLVSTFVTAFVVVLILAAILWCAKKWRRRRETFHGTNSILVRSNSKSQSFHGIVDKSFPLQTSNGNMKSYDEMNGSDMSTSVQIPDSEDSYHRIGGPSMSTTHEIQTPYSDDSNGVSSNVSEISNSNSTSDELVHYDTTSTFDQVSTDEDSDYRTRHQFF